jgi:YidC/Oxa1 family membrane protein insertase
MGSWVDVGIGVIVLTILVKTILFPLSLKAVRQQQLMKKLEEPLKEIREKYKDNKEEQGKQMLELYKKEGVNPLSGFGLILVQLPIIIGLYLIFARGGLPALHPEFIYSWINSPSSDQINMYFLGLVDMAGKSMILAILTGISQFIQAQIAFPKTKPRKDNATFQEDFARSMQLNMKFVFPVLIGTFAYAFNAAVALYWFTSNIFAIGTELLVKRKYRSAPSATS